MDSSRHEDVTGLLVAWRDGNPQALDELIPIVYAELRRIARQRLRGERSGHSLQPTALTHEAFLRLFGARQVDWQDRAHFFAVASQLMRRILVEHARNRGAAKRGGGATRVTLDEVDAPAESADVDVVALHEALARLEAVDPRQSRIVELRYFGGLSIEETAEVLGASPATIKRDWRVAKLWLRRALEDEKPA
jgi:RNA polymerase sigma factor (TIGR02999 family)